MIQFKSIAISLGAAAVIFSGCGGSSEQSNDNTNVTTGTGYYLDSAVSGVSYTCGSRTGVTGEDGSFSYEVGQSCTFQLAGITLRHVDADMLQDQVKIVEDDLKVARMLQIMDKDGDPSNGITIEAAIITEMQAAGITSLPDTEEEFTAVFDAIKDVEGYTGELKTVEAVQTHLAQTQKSVLIEMLAGKTLYEADYNVTEDEDYIDQVVFNADLTSLTWTTIGGASVDDSATETFEVVGDRLVFADDIYAEIAGQTSKYLVINSYEHNGTLADTTRFYFNQADVEAYYNSLKADANSSNSDNGESIVPSEVDFTGLTGTTIYEVYFDGDEEEGFVCSALQKSIGKIEFTSASTITYTGLVGEEAGNSGSVNFTVSGNVITSEEGDQTTFFDVEGKPYFMLSHWVGAGVDETDVNYYFETEAEANAFVLPQCRAN